MIVISAVMSEEQLASCPPLVADLDVVVVKSLYITLFIHKEQFALGIQFHASRVTIKLSFWGAWDGCMDCSIMKSVIFRVFRHKAGMVRSDEETRLRFWLFQSEKRNQFMLAVLYKSVVLQTKVPFNKS